MKSKAAVRRIVEALKKLYPDALCSLQYQKDYELLFAVRLSAQCTDARVNMVTPALYAKFPTLEAFANASYEEVGEAIKSCGFYNTKSKDLVECAKILLEKYGGRVPGTMEELTSLPGIGRKTANLILGDIYHQPAYVCDTHCIRITGRLGLTDGSKDPLSVEKQLRAVLPPEESSDFCHRMVLFGRDRCTARKANCDGRCAPTATSGRRRARRHKTENRKACLRFRRHVFSFPLIYCFERIGTEARTWIKIPLSSLKNSAGIPPWRSRSCNPATDRSSCRCSPARTAAQRSIARRRAPRWATPGISRRCSRA